MSACCCAANSQATGTHSTAQLVCVVGNPCQHPPVQHVHDTCFSTEKHCCRRCGRIWRHHARRKAVQRSIGTAQATTPSTAPATPAGDPAPSVASATAAAGSLLLLESGALLSALLLNPTHESVRRLSVRLLKQLCGGSPHMTVRLVSRLAAMLPQAAAAGQCGCIFAMPAFDATCVCACG